MAISYQVKAQVVDLRSDSPRTTDAFLVDSNVWFWAAYSNVSYATPAPQVYQSREYPGYLQKVIARGGRLYWCGLSVSELAHRIEDTEFKIAQESGGTAATNPKEYRHNDPAERRRVVGEIVAAWNAVESMASPLPDAVVIDSGAVKQALADMALVCLDTYDLFLVQALRAAAVIGIVSDDGDFCTVPSITLFTANRTVINAAQVQRHLVVR